METVNITDVIIKNIYKQVMLSDNGEHIVRSLLDYNFDKILGTSEFNENDIDYVIVLNGSKTLTINMNTIYLNDLSFKITSEDADVVVSGYQGNNPIMSLTVNVKDITDNISYQEGTTDVIEQRSVGIEYGDARKFKIERFEDGELAYDGTLTPILVKAGDVEYFDFDSSLLPEKADSKSLFKRIVDNMKGSTIVSVTTTRDVHTIAEYSDSIFTALDEKLESLRVKQAVRVRKIDNKND